MKKRTDGVCIRICKFEKTGKTKQSPSSNNLIEKESKCIGCGYTCWITEKKEKNE